MVTTQLCQAGHSVTTASRSGNADLILDIRASSGLHTIRRVMHEHDVLINASGVEELSLAEFDSLIEVSATGSYLEQLAQNMRPGARAVLGAGLAPGLSTLLISALDYRPGDEIDVGIVLGLGDRHGAAAVAWTAGLLGRRLHQPPESRPILNFREHRRLPAPGGGSRRFLRADFPDHVLIGNRRGLTVRSYLALSSRLATWALNAASYSTGLGDLVARTPHVGSTTWQVIAINRTTSEAIAVEGAGQSAATGVLTAAAGERLAETGGQAVCSMDGIITLPDAVYRIGASMLHWHV